jgi:hypothetical protein
MAAHQRRDPNSVLFALMTVPAKGKGAEKISSEYRGFQYLFEKAKWKKALLKHRS